MPSSYNHPLKPFSVRKTLPSPKPKSLAGTPAPAAAEAERKAASPKCPNTVRVRVRVICTDPDATDSSCDEEDDVGRLPRIRSAKRRVTRELLLPTGLALPPRGYADNSADLPKASAWKKRSNAGKSAKGVDMGVRRRQCGKWAAAVCDPSRGVRLWLNGPQARTNFIDFCESNGHASNEETSAPLLVYDSLQSNLPLVSRNVDSVGSAFLVSSSSADNVFSDLFSNEWSEDSTCDMADNVVESKNGDSHSMATNSLQSAVVSLNSELHQNSVCLNVCMDSGNPSCSLVDTQPCFEELGRILDGGLESIDTIGLGIDFDSTIVDTDNNFELDSEALCWIETFGVPS